MLSAIIITGLVFAAAATGGFFKPGEWYASLDKPSWTPPNYVFPIVWIILYCMIAYSGVIIWHTGESVPILLWGTQLLLNALWSFLFFGRRNMTLAMVDIFLLLICIIAYIFVAFSVSEIAAVLFIPYGIWVAVAAALNWRIIQLNP